MNCVKQPLGIEGVPQLQGETPPSVWFNPTPEIEKSIGIEGSIAIVICVDL